MTETPANEMLTALGLDLIAEEHEMECLDCAKLILASVEEKPNVVVVLDEVKR